jgi:predicted DNA-binding transcriptional regulator YafY
MILTKSGYPQKDNAYSLEFKDSFGFFMDKNKKNAVIRFSGKVVREVSNIKWTAVQKTKNNPEDKSCEFKLEYPASGSRELILKVLSYGADAEVISPEELRQEWLAEISRLSAYMTKKSKK